jgi:hypothetical protein
MERARVNFEHVEGGIGYTLYSVRLDQVELCQVMFSYVRKDQIS